MIPCTEFIPAYSELFRYLESRGGKEAVVRFWEYLSDRYLGNLHGLVKEHGLRGCWLYWTQTLNEEAANFTMELDEEKQEFRIDMHLCPSMSRLIECAHLDPYPDYCEHCDVLYARVLKPLGFDCVVDMSQCDAARCVVTVRPQPRHSEGACHPERSEGSLPNA